VPDGIHAAEDRTQPARIDGAGDRAAANAGGQQLVATDHTVLTIGEGTDPVIAMIGAFVTHVMYKAPGNAISPPRCGESSGYRRSSAIRTPSPTSTVPVRRSKRRSHGPSTNARRARATR
jgi:hypothetical protein